MVEKVTKQKGDSSYKYNIYCLSVNYNALCLSACYQTKWKWCKLILLLHGRVVRGKKRGWCNLDSICSNWKIDCCSRDVSCVFLAYECLWGRIVLRGHRIWRTSIGWMTLSIVHYTKCGPEKENNGIWSWTNHMSRYFACSTVCIQNYYWAKWNKLERLEVWQVSCSLRIWQIWTYLVFLWKLNW